MNQSDQESGPVRRGLFSTTQWSLVVAAGEGRHTEARDALAALCRTYWHPLYVFARRRGADSESARDLTQGFFAKLLEKEYVKDARRERGRFRSFLLTSFKHYIANEWDKEQALKRGGGLVPISLDALEAERTYELEPADPVTPEKLFDRRWARTLLARSLRRLGEEMSGRGQERRFESLSPYLSGEASTGYRDAAAALGMSESALKVAVHRMRRRFRAIIREEVAHTVREPAEVDDELQHLLAALRS